MLSGYITSTGGLVGTTSNHPLSIRTNNTDRITVENGGQVGIGTANPGQLLEVNGSGANLKVVSDANVYLSLDTTQTNGDEWHIFNANSGATSTLQFKNVDQSKVVMLMDETGKIGIGTTSPQRELDVVGDIRASGDVIASRMIISSSVTHLTQSFSSGSTIFGDDPADTHQFTGSLRISGSDIHLNDGQNNIILGTTSSPAGDAITTGTFNVLLGGNNAGGAINSGAQNVGIGGSALEQVTTGDGNIAIGYNSGQGNTGADHNISIGTGAGDLTGPGNVAVGKGTLSGNNSGEYNVAIGFDAGNDVTTGQDNVLIGKNAADSLTTGPNNVIILSLIHI